MNMNEQPEECDFENNLVHCLSHGVIHDISELLIEEREKERARIVGIINKIKKTKYVQVDIALVSNDKPSEFAHEYYNEALDDLIQEVEKE